MLHNWYRLDIEVELRDDWERPKVPWPKCAEYWFIDTPLEAVFTPAWLNEYYPLLGVNALVIFYYKKNQVAPKTHIDWRRRWVLNFILEPDGRELTWYPEVPVSFEEPEDHHHIRNVMKNYSPLGPLDPEQVTDRMCFDTHPRRLHLLRTDVPHHVGNGAERWGFSLYNYLEWDTPYADAVERLRPRLSR